MTGTQITHVPYKGSAPAVTDLLAGQVQVMFDNTPNVLPHVKAGKLKALGVSSKTRSPLAPEIPTVDEAGVPGYEVGVWFGVLTVAGTPRGHRQRLNTEMVKILTSPEIKERFGRIGVDVVAGTPEQFTPFLKARWRAGPRWSRTPASRPTDGAQSARSPISAGRRPTASRCAARTCRARSSAT